VVRRDVRFTHSAVRSDDHSERTSLETSESAERYTSPAVVKMCQLFRYVTAGILLQPSAALRGTPGGCETAIHAARRYIQSMTNKEVVVKLDFSNAFNSLLRSDMLQAVRDRVPELFPYCYTSYAHFSWLFYGPDVVLSQEGAQQGNPLSPLLFSNTSQPLLQPLASALRLACLDDVTLGGSVDVVAADIQTEGEAMGLCLNNKKCEIIAYQQTVISDPTLCSFNRVNVDDAELLGAPLFAGRVLDTARGCTWQYNCNCHIF